MHDRREDQDTDPQWEDCRARVAFEVCFCTQATSPRSRACAGHIHLLGRKVTTLGYVMPQSHQDRLNLLTRASTSLDWMGESFCGVEDFALDLPEWPKEEWLAAGQDCSHMLLLGISRDVLALSPLNDKDPKYPCIARWDD
jgi:hypothetical protein